MKIYKTIVCKNIVQLVEKDAIVGEIQKKLRITKKERIK
jgi:hypothetical protein